MSPQALFVMTMAVAGFAGLANMLGQTVLFAIVFATAPLWWPEVFGFYPLVLSYAASLLISTLTLMLGGVPAALAERLLGAREPRRGPMMIWLGCVILLTLAGLAFGRF